MPPGGYERSASQMLLATLQKHHLVQLQRETTRENSILDLYITNRPTLTKEINTIPNISDHEGAILVDASITPMATMKPPRKCLLFSKANWPKMKDDMQIFTDEFLETANAKSLNENWEDLKNKIHSITNEHVPSRMTKSKTKTPWMNQQLKRMSRKKARLFRTAKKSNNPKRMKHFKEFQKVFKKECRKAHTDYINSHVVSGIKNGNTKPFYRYIKSLKNDSTGLAPLKNGPSLLTSASSKSEALLNEFSSVFTQEDSEAIPWLGPAQHKMDDIVVAQDGVQKLLAQLQPHKAAGPDRSLTECLKS